MFRELEGEEALLVENGIYKPCTLHELNGYLFAKYGGGYIRLYENGATSKIIGNKNPVQLQELHLSAGTPVYRDAHGRLMLSRVDPSVSLVSGPSRQKLGLPPPPPETTK